MRKGILAGGLSLSLAVTGGAWAQDVAWQARAPRTVIASTAPEAAPLASLGRPIVTAPATTQANANPVREEAFRPVSYAPENPPGPIVRAQMAEPPPPIPAPPPAFPGPGRPGFAAPAVSPAERYNCGMMQEPAGGPIPPPPPGAGGGMQQYLGWIPGVGNGDTHCFKSDHCFDGFISPLTNPFYFEDPRSLTELRPIFMYQGFPGKNWAVQGGNGYFFGTQARLAFCDKFSIVLNKLGGIWDQPSVTSVIGDSSGLAEIWIGPKWTFLRNENSGTLGALGLTFEIPVGSSSVFQNIGDLSLTPYLTMGQNFWRTSYGSVNVLGTLGYSFSVNSTRSQHFFTSLHFDYDIANAHKFYPLFELHWFQYTKDGTANAFGFEGRDLYNFGAFPVSGQTEMDAAFGMRYKFSECAQLGVGAEFPITGRHNMLDWRLTIDFILRY